MTTATPVNIERWLEQWGHWCNRGGSPLARGYSRTTTIGRYLKDGGVTDSSAGPRPIDVDPVAERMEGLMQQLGLRYPIAAEALTLQYVYSQGLGAIARELRLAVKTTNTHQRIGKAWLEGMIEAGA